MAKNAVTSELKDLQHHESVIWDTYKGFIYMGASLDHIRLNRLYKAREFETFEAYCDQVFDLRRSRVYQIIDASKSAMLLQDLRQKDDTVKIPHVEAHALAIYVNADDDDDRKKLWLETLKRCEGRKITVPKIEEIADEMFPKPKTNGNVVETTARHVKSVEPAKSAPVATPPVSESDESEPDDEPVVFTGKPSGGTSFNPEQFDETIQRAPSPPKKSADPKVDFERRLAFSSSQLKSLFSDLGPLIRSFDEYNATSSLKNSKAIIATYDRLHGELEKAVATMAQLVKSVGLTNSEE